MMDLAILVLRIGLGLIFVAHGLQKAFGMFAGPNIEGFSKMLSSLGFSQPVFWAYIAAYTELIGGLGLIFGVLTRTSAAFLLIFITVAAFKVHLSKGFFLQSGGYEYTLLIAFICIALIILGPGKFSLMNKL